jgi:hypothetical protein
MPVSGPRAVFVLISVLGGFTGCSLSVSFDGSRYQCDPPAGDCPPGYACAASGFCMPEQVTTADAAPDDSGTSPGPDGSIGPPPPDASVTPMSVTVTFGERPTSMIQGVTRDGEVDSDNPNGNYGGDNEFFCGRHPGASQIWVGLLRFDVSAIPAGATVQSASMSLWTGGDPLDNGTVQWHALLEDWSEGNGDNTGPAGVANYIQRIQGTAWRTVGAGAPSSSDAAIVTELATPLGNSEYTFPLPAVLVQLWVDFPQTNFGMSCFVAPGVDSDTDYKAHESSQTGHRPELTVTYVP